MTIEYFAAQKNIGLLSVRPFNLENDIETLFAWTSQPYARYWGYVDSTIDELKADYKKLCNNGHTRVFLGTLDGQAMFLLELYDPSKEKVGGFYENQSGDLGMHILIAPSDKPIHNFTYTIFTFIMEFMFEDPAVKRIVVEPDANNEKIHSLNRRAGFQHIKEIDLGYKKALLAFCTRDDFTRAMKLASCDNNSRFQHQGLHTDPQNVVSPLTMDNWNQVNRHLVRKAISESAHERIIFPKLVDQAGRYEIISDDGETAYYFDATVMELNHWAINGSSIEKKCNGKLRQLDVVKFVLEFYQTLGVPQDKLPTYLEEITSTLSSAAFKLYQAHFTSKELITRDFQDVETGMTEGHPAFIANNGRIGFDAGDFRSYAPEAGNEIQLLWLATHKSRTHFASGESYSYQQLIEDEFDVSTIKNFENILKAKDLQPDDYLLMPVHPWQWFNKLSNVYASDVASQKIVCLGYGDDHYLAQQSIRTFFNVSHPKKHYVKTALSILNMGFMRGLSAYYMRTTPAINDWLYNLVTQDSVLTGLNFRILREIAAIGYSNPYFEDERLADNPYKKMLAGLWRESPVDKIADNQNLMTMASLLHVDSEGKGILPALIKQSGLSAEDWLDQYLQSYLSPLLHCYFKYSLVFMPHGENLIMVMEDHVPVGMFMKDIGEEICLLNSKQKLPEDVARISVEMPAEMEELSVFTDMFDGFFRYMNEILVMEIGLDEQVFWRRAAKCISDYQSAHPEFDSKYSEHDLFAKEFAHSCLNRLQLGNNQKMVDLTDPGGSLKFAGTLNNPVAKYRSSSASVSGKQKEVIE